MLRITTIEQDGSATILKLEGKLLAAWIGELDEACRQACLPATAATLDLSGVSFVDAPGTVALRDWRRRGMRLVGCSPLVTELLKENER
jgi:anti-anti-sigma regulatory factor